MFNAQLVTVYEPHSGRLFACVEDDADPEHLIPYNDLPVLGPFADAGAARAWSRRYLGVTRFTVAVTDQRS
jgi:hypothetical protein